jgi:hypothetical protein
MTKNHFTDKDISFLKRSAKQLKKELGCTHTEALQTLAHRHGYSSWELLCRNVSSVTTVDIKNWFFSLHFHTNNPYKHPTVSVDHILRYQFPAAPEKLLNEVATALNNKGLWGSIPAMTIIHEYRPPRRTRYINGRYEPCKIIGIRLNVDYPYVTFEVPTIRLQPARYQKDYFGQLWFKCPICGENHTHGAVGPKLGDGNGNRSKHCALNNRNLDRTGFAFDLVEMESTDLVGYVPKSTRFYIDE